MTNKKIAKILKKMKCAIKIKEEQYQLVRDLEENNYVVFKRQGIEFVNKEDFNRIVKARGKKINLVAEQKNIIWKALLKILDEMEKKCQI